LFGYFLGVSITFQNGVLALLIVTRRLGGRMFPCNYGHNQLRDTDRKTEKSKKGSQEQTQNCNG
jgi:hypothetical protein